MHGSQGGNLGRLRDRWEGGPGAAVVIAVVALILVPILTGCSSGNTPEPAARPSSPEDGLVLRRAVVARAEALKGGKRNAPVEERSLR
jgi:hypothetical protein